MVEFLGYSAAGTRFPDFARVLTVYALDKVCYVR